MTTAPRRVRLGRRQLLQAGTALATAALAGTTLLRPTPGRAQSQPADAGLSPADAADVGRVQDYLNAVRSLSAHFIQLGPDGSLARGRFFLRRPGRLRFEYDPPSPLLIVADGVWLVLYDRELNQVSRFPLGESPLAVLAADQVDLTAAFSISAVQRQAGLLRLQVVDNARPDDGWLALTFSDPPLALRQWHVRDAQGGVTSVALEGLETNLPLDPELFVFIDPAPFRE